MLTYQASCGSSAILLIMIPCEKKVFVDKYAE